MKTISYLVLSILLILNMQLKSIGQENTNLKGEKISTNFTKLKVCDGVVINIKQGGEQEIYTDGSKPLSEIITFTVKDDELIINKVGNNEANLYLKFINLVKITSTDVSQIQSNDYLKFADLEIISKDVSKQILKFEANSVTITTNDASKIEFEGKATSSNIKANDATKIKMQNFDCLNCNVSTNDASNVWVNCIENISATTNDVSSLYYKNSTKKN